MQKKKTLIISILIILTLIGFIYLAIYFPKIQNFYYAEFTCGNEGQIVGAAKLPTTCCEGLKRISGSDINDFDENCNLISVGGLQICSNCGNNICEPENWENKCNCPEDCN